MSAMLPLMDFLESGKFVQSIKHGSELSGLRAGGVRAPLQPLEPSEKLALESVIKTLQKNVARIVEEA
jgi:4-hydroxy-tetrahydrodipicolinate synthase